MGLRAKLVLAFMAVPVLAMLTVSILEVDWVTALMVSNVGRAGELLVNQTFEQVREVLNHTAADPYQALKQDHGLAAFLQSTLAFGQGVVYISIDDPRGVTIVSAPAVMPAKVAVGIQPFSKLENQAVSFWPLERIETLWGDHTYEISRPIKVNNRPFGVIRLGLSPGLIIAEVERAVEGVLIVGAASILISIGAAMLLGTALVRPLRALTLGMEQLASGDEVRLNVAERDELGALADRFNRLSTQLRSDRARWEDERGQFFNIFRSITDAVLLLDRQQTILFANAEAQQRLGLPAGGLAHGKPLKLLLGANHPLARMVETVQVTGTEVQNVALELGEGERRSRFLISISSLGHGPEPPGLLVVVRDLVPVQELESVVDHSGRLVRLGGLISGVAHQIRTPLNTLNLLTELLSQSAAAGGPIEPRIEMIRKQIRRLDDAITGLTRFMRPEELRPASFDLNELIREIGGQVTQPGVTVHYEIDPQLKPVRADKALLGEALRNVVNNAVEAMPEGGVLTLSSGTRGDELIEIGVSDQGRGIPPEQLERIFHLYFTTKEGGSGLGLPLALRAVDLHGGTIDVQSTVGSGTKVLICLPPLEARAKGVRPQREHQAITG